MKRFLALLLVLSICFAGCMRKEENPQPLPFPDMELDAEAQDMAVLGGSIYWCADGKLYRLDPPRKTEPRRPGKASSSSTVFPSRICPRTESGWLCVRLTESCLSACPARTA